VPSGPALSATRLRCQASQDLLAGADHRPAADGGTVSVTVCDDQAGAEESNRVASDWLKTNMPELGGATPGVSAGEVLIDA